MSLFSRFFGKQPPKDGSGGAPDGSEDGGEDPNAQHQGQGQPVPQQGVPQQQGPQQPGQGMQMPPQNPAHGSTQRVIPPGVLNASAMQPPQGPPPGEEDPGVVLPEPAVEVASVRPPSVDPRFAHWGGNAAPEFTETVPPVRDYKLDAQGAPIGAPAGAAPQARPQQPPLAGAPQGADPAGAAPRRRDSPTNFHKVDPRSTTPLDAGPKHHPRLHPNDALPSIIVDIPKDEPLPQRAPSHRQATQPILKSPGPPPGAPPPVPQSQPRVPGAAPSSPGASSSQKVIIAPAGSQPKLGAPAQAQSQPQQPVATPAATPQNAPVVQQRSTVVMHGSLLAAHMQGSPPPQQQQPSAALQPNQGNVTMQSMGAQPPPPAPVTAPLGVGHSQSQPQPQPVPPPAPSAPAVHATTPTPAMAREQPPPGHPQQSPQPPPPPPSSAKSLGATSTAGGSGRLNKQYQRTLVGGLAAPTDSLVAEEVSPKPANVRQEPPRTDSLRDEPQRSKAATLLGAGPSASQAPPPMRSGSVPPPRPPPGAASAPPPAEPAVIVARVVAIDADPKPLPIPTDLLAGTGAEAVDSTRKPQPGEGQETAEAREEEEDDDEFDDGDDLDDAPTIVRTGTSASAVNAPEVIAARAALEKREAIARIDNDAPPAPVTPPPQSPTPVSRVDEKLPPQRGPMRTELQLQEYLPPALAQAAAVAAQEDQEYEREEAAVRPKNSVPPALPDESEWPTATQLPDPEAWDQPEKPPEPRRSAIEEILAQAEQDEQDDITEARFVQKGPSRAPRETKDAREAQDAKGVREQASPSSKAPPTEAQVSLGTPSGSNSPFTTQERRDSDATRAAAPISAPISAAPATEAIPRMVETIVAPPGGIEIEPDVVVPAPPRLWADAADADVLAEVDAGFGALESLQSTPPTESAVFDDARELFTDIAATTMHHVRDFMMDLTLAPTTAEWLALCIPATQSLRMGAEAFEMRPLVGALDEFLRALQAVSDSSTPIVEGEARERLLSIYGDLASAMPKAFKLDRDRGMREGIIVRALLNQLEDVRKVQQDRLFAAGLMSLEALCTAKPRDIVETTGLSMDLATRISERFRRYKLEVSTLGAGGGENPAEWNKLKEYVTALDNAHRAFEEASAKNNSRGKKESRRARELALLDVKVMLARLGQPESLGFIERAPFADKLSHLTALIDKSEPR